MIKSWKKYAKDAEEEKHIEDRYKQSKYIRNLLAQLIQDKLDSETKATRSKNLYDNPNWAYRQADSKGYERALSEILQLIEK